MVRIPSAAKAVFFSLSLSPFSLLPACSSSGPPDASPDQTSQSASPPVHWSTSLPQLSPLTGCAPGYDVAIADLHISSSGGCNLPAIIHIHGGGWYSGSPDDMDVYRGAELATGIVYVSVDYPMFPNSMSTMLTSIQLAINFLRTESGLLGVDPERLGVIGESAGGQLALQGGIQDGDLRFIGSLFGPTDMSAEETNFCGTLAAYAPAQELCVVIDAIMGGTAATATGNYNAYSPIDSVSNLQNHEQAPYFYFGESAGDLLVPVGTVDTFTNVLSAHGVSLVNDRLPAAPGIVGHNLTDDELTYLRSRAVIDAINAMNAPRLPAPSFAPPPAPAPAPAPGGPAPAPAPAPAPPPAPPPSCTCTCSSQIGLVSASDSNTASTCDAARGPAVTAVQDSLFEDVLIVGYPWTAIYTEAIGIPVNCQCQ